MRSDPEGEVPVRAAVRHEVHRRVEHRLVPVGRQEVQRDGAAFRDPCAADLGRAGRDADQCLVRGVEAEKFLDERAKRRGVVPQKPHVVGVHGQVPGRRAEEVARHHVPADQHQPHHSGKLDVVEGRVARRIGDQAGDEVGYRVARCRAAVGDEAFGEAVDLPAERAGRPQVLALDRDDVVMAQAADLERLVPVEPEEEAERALREGLRIPAREICRLGAFEQLVEEVARQGTEGGFEAADPVLLEERVQRLAVTIAFRRILLQRQAGQPLARRRGDHGHLRGGERLGIAARRRDVRMAHEGIEPAPVRRPGHGRRRTQARMFGGVVGHGAGRDRVPVRRQFIRTLGSHSEISGT